MRRKPSPIVSATTQGRLAHDDDHRRSRRYAVAAKAVAAITTTVTMSQNGHATLCTEAIMTAVPHAATALPPAAIRTRKRKSAHGHSLQASTKVSVAARAKRLRATPSAAKYTSLARFTSRYFRASVLRRQWRRAFGPEAAWLGATFKVAYGK